jgi:hypothetical protein
LFGEFNWVEEPKISYRPKMGIFKIDRPLRAFDAILFKGVTGSAGKSTDNVQYDFLYGSSNAYSPGCISPFNLHLINDNFTCSFN